MSAAVTAGLVQLSTTERALFDALAAEPGWVEARQLRRAVWGENAPYYARNVLNVYLARLRHRLSGTGWRVENGRPRSGGWGVYRLVRDEPVDQKGVPAA